MQGQARMLLALGRAAEALPVLRRMVAMEPSMAEPMRKSVQEDPRLRPVYKDWGLSYFHHALYMEALSSLSAYLDDVDPRDYACHMGMGWSFLRLGYSQRSRDSFSEAAAQRPQAADPLAGMGAAALALGNVDEARSQLDRALAIEPDNALALNTLGHLALAQGDSQKALERFRAALASRPDYVESRLAVARILFDRAEYDAAAAEFFRLVTQEQRSLAGWNGLGWARLRLGQYDDALAAFAEARRLAPSLPAAAYGMGITLARQGRTEEAARRLAEAIFISPDFAATPEVIELMRRPEYTELFLEMGEAYSRKLYPTAAAPYLEEYLQRNPNSRPGRRALAWASFWAGQEDKAHALFQTLITVNKDDPDAHLGDGMALLSRNHLDMAEPHLREAVRLDPANALAWRALALLLQRQGKDEEAAATLRSEPRSRMERLDRMSASGFAALAEGRARDAVRDFRRAEALDSGLAAPHYGMAFALVGLGDARQAREELLAGLNLDPAFLDEQALARLFARHAELGGLGLDLAWSQLYALNLPAARAGFERILAASPGNLEAQFGQGATAYLQSDWQLAESSFDKLLPRAPQSAPSWDKWSHLMDKLGWAAYHQKKFDKALHVFDWLRTYHPQTPYAASLAGMGWALLALDKPSQAQNLFLRSLTIFPRNLTAMQGLTALKKDAETDEQDMDDEPEPVVHKVKGKKAKVSRAADADDDRPAKKKSRKKSKKSQDEAEPKAKKSKKAKTDDADEPKVKKSKKAKAQDEAETPKKKRKKKSADE
jgi:tetratricopeptide (TPR) repeat protein